MLPLQCCGLNGVYACRVCWFCGKAWMQFADIRIPFTHRAVCLMFKKTENPTACEMRSVIRFLNAKNMKPAEIHRQLCDAYGEHAMSTVVSRWVRLFNEDVKMCVMICGSADRLWWLKIWCVQLKRRLERTDDSPLHHFPEISRSLLHKIVSDKL